MQHLALVNSIKEVLQAFAPVCRSIRRIITSICHRVPEDELTLGPDDFLDITEVIQDALEEKEETDDSTEETVL